MRVLGVRRTVVSVALVLASSATAWAAGGAAPVREQPGDNYDLVTVSARGKMADESSFGAATSRDGRWVAFTSYALNLDPRVRPTRNKQVYLWDRRTGHARLAVLRPTGGLLRDAEVAALSPSGRYLAFCSRDPKVVRPDSYDQDAGLFYRDQDVFVADLRSGRVHRASSDFRGGQSDGYSCAPQVADTGDVVFSSRATDLVRGDTDEVPDVFLYDWSSQRVRLLTTAEVGDVTFDISGDGGTVAVVTTEALVDRDANAFSDLYVYERKGGALGGRWELGLTRPDGSVTRGGMPFDGVSLSHDGRFVTGMSADGGIADPPVADKSTHLWLRDRRTGRTTLVNPTAAESSDVTDVHVSDDGRTVVYLGGDLGFGGVPPDDDGLGEVFAWRRGRGIVSLTRGDRVWAVDQGLGLSGDGAWVSFAMLRDDVPGLDPIVEPARVVLYRTRVRRR